MKQITSIRDNVDLITLGNRSIYLVGTAHISQSSADLAEEIIRQMKPDSVAVELCESRYQSLKDPDRWKNMDILSVIRQGKAYVLMAQLALAGFQKKLGDQLNVKPGAEMMRAVNTAEELQCLTVMADRDIKTTLKRTWASLSLWTTFKLVGAMMNGLFSSKKIDEKEIEELKSSDALASLLKEFSDALPKVRTALIDERDQYLANRIENAPGNTVVAVIGAGHIPGIKNWIGQSVDVSALEVVPPPGKLGKIISWGIPAAVIGMIVAGFFTSGFSTSAEMVKSWIWITGFTAALGAALALAHPLTILAAFVSAPITSLHPLLASGWVAGLVEAVIRKPRVSDLESIATDVVSMRGLWSNRVSRILLIVAFTNLLGTIGALYGAKVLASHL